MKLKQDILYTEDWKQLEIRLCTGERQASWNPQALGWDYTQMKPF